MTWVIDASVAAKWFLPEDGQAEALALLDDRIERVAPDWILAEIAHIAFKKWRDGEITRDHAQAMLSGFPDYLKRLHPSADLVDRALFIAITIRHPVYDCFYLAAAEASDGTVLTADQRFRNAAAGTAWSNRVRHLTSWQDADPP